MCLPMPVNPTVLATSSGVPKRFYRYHRLQLILIQVAGHIGFDSPEQPRSP